MKWNKMKKCYVDSRFKFNCTYKVVSIFNDVINLKYKGFIYSIFNEYIKPAPNTLIVDSNFFEYIKSNLRQELFIPYLNGEVFSCYLQYKKYSPNLSVLKNKVDLLIREDSLVENVFQSMRFNCNLDKLLGLGVGLTPSGDDYIVGYMAGYYSQYKGILSQFNTLSILAKEKTNEISASYIFNASNRFFKQEILDVVNNLDNEYYIEQLIKIGSSSGQDILYGIYDYFSRDDFKLRIGI